MLLGACSDSSKDSETTDEHAGETPTTVADLTDVVHPPASGEFEGALTDITDQTCVQEADGWRVTGTATNPTSSPADYRIYISLLNGDSVTRALVETEILAVAAGATGTFDELIAMPDTDLQCVLRVERRASS
jgi:hypothetical protein